VPRPSHAEPPLGERLVDDQVAVPPLGDDSCRLQRASEGRGDHGRIVREAFGAVLGLAPAGR